MKTLQEKKLDAYLDAPRWMDKGQPVTMRQRLNSIAITGKRKDVEEYAKRKTGLEYKKLSAPKITYFIEYRKGAEDFQLEVPKMVYDWVIAVENK